MSPEYWQAAADFRRRVHIQWRRELFTLSLEVKGPGRPVPPDVERFSVADGVWEQRAGIHYLTYADPEHTQGVVQTLAGHLRRDHTTLCLRPDEVSLTRTGEVSWSHTFRPAERVTTALRTGKALLEVEILTEQLELDVHPDGGRLRCTYQMRLGRPKHPVPQAVALEIWWRP
ncbi:MAG: DUF1934 domain-containing protein [Alicyclobacillus sp.]|nr:DUF1934 domain-containing protein [Alicyclobacillus sp.]